MMCSFVVVNSVRCSPCEGYAADILPLVEATPDVTLAEIAELLFNTHGELHYA